MSPTSPRRLLSCLRTPMFARALVPLALTTMLAAAAEAQPFNVRAWYAQGQVFIVWQNTAPPALPTDTVEIYSSAAAQVNVSNMTRLGRLFYPEYTAARLQELFAGARALIPTPGGGTYRLAADEGVFAYTPHAAGNQFFAVVDTGSAMVNAGNSAAAAFNYDPTNEPIRPHRQFNGVTAGGNPYTAFLVWADGSNAFDNSRPDFPVMADADKNGVPHVFVVSNPVGGLPAGPLSCLFAHHGGGGEYQLFLPGVPARANVSLPLTNGIVVTPDDSYYANVEGQLGRSNTSWFGYATDVDPFFGGARTSPSGAVPVVNFTQRRVHWILDWLLSPNSPYQVDPQRVAAIGHSGGGRGLSHLSRLRPERYSSVVVYTPASDLSIDEGGRVNFLRGSWDENLATNLIGPTGATLGVTDVFTPTTRLSPTQRDFALTRYFYGKRDEDSAASWSPAQRAVVDSLNASEMGGMVFWDEREHGVEKWDVETNDAADGHAGPWPDIGQWVAPVRTRRASGQYLVDQYRASQSYPGVFNADQNLQLAGRQPDPGPGDPDLGDRWGTWGGYLDWDTGTIVDQANQWACTLFLATGQAASIDNSPAAMMLADFAPRKTQRFNPAPGTRVYWYALPLGANVVSQQGEVIAETGGVVKVRGLSIPRQDVERLRVVLSLAPLCLGTQSVSAPDNALSCPGSSASFSVTASGSGPFTFRWQIETPNAPGVWTNLSNGNLPGIGQVSGATSSSLTISLLPATAAARVRCAVTNTCGTAASSAATLRVCAADFNCDGFVDFFDFDDFVTAFESGDPRGDFNRDGFIDFFDFDDYVVAFERGC
jgi:hypothetical protein